MKTVHEVSALREQVHRWKRAGERVGFVPTMGNLHEGHLQLLDRARQVSDRVVVSIFVNPLQFGPSEDLDRYPRTLSEDSRKLQDAGCDLLFAPSVEQMYPGGREGLTQVSVPALSKILEGEFRPGFFEGVATVVNILFNQVQPDVAVFGEKDYQQLQVIRRMVTDLHLPIEIIGHPTARADDGLALSSRNQYLSSEQRMAACALNAALNEIAEQLRLGCRDFNALQNKAIADIQKAGFKAQYFEIRAPDLSLMSEDAHNWVVVAAAFMGDTRLIDNISVSA